MKTETLVCLFLSVAALQGAETTAELKNVSLSGGLSEGKARVVIEADLRGLPEEREKLLYATTLHHTLRATPDKLSHTFTLKLDILQGVPKEIALALSGAGGIRQVTGAGLLDWGLRQETNGARFLVLRFPKTDKPLTQFTGTVTAETELKELPGSVTPLTLTPAQPAWFNGYVLLQSAPELHVEPVNPAGLVPVELKFLPEELRGLAKPDEPEPLAFRFHGSAYSIPLKLAPADPESRRVVLRDFKLIGQLGDQTAAFTLTAKARVNHPQGGMLDLLSGGVALIDYNTSPDWRLKFDQGRFILSFDQPGEFPLELKFHAAVRPQDGWNHLAFRVAPSALQPLILQGLPADTQFEFPGGARPERQGLDFVTYLPANGEVKLGWRSARPEAEGRLFFSAEMLSQISVSPGLMRQAALLEFKVMQGELNRVTLLLRGAGEVTRVAGSPVLAWTVEPGPTPSERRLNVQLNAPQKDQFALQVQMETALGTFPLAADAVQLRPEGATRFAGWFRIVNEGAVRLEVVQATGLSQISPEQFPESDATRALFRAAGAQRFAYRFSGPDFALRIQADNVLPELHVSELLAYHLGETELAVEAELEVDVREAPVRELLLRVPRGYALARLNASELSDYFLREPADQPEAELRLVFGKPVSGRQVVQVRLERNQALGAPAWAVPRLEVLRAKSTRGHVGVSADAGFRLTPEQTAGLTEIATAFFPKKVPGIQAAFRLSDPAWQATLRVERLPQSIQADVFHLFSIGEGIAYGSSTINYLIAGAPVAAFRIELSPEYFNVEFAGRDVRHWQKTTNGFVVQLHTPVSGAYTLLATYERPFKAQGDTLTFTGARPLDAQTEQGHTLVISAYQFEVRPVQVSAGLLELEPGEVPAEYRLFFDAPILKAYRYTSRPFSLQLALSPLAQGETLSQVVDRAALTTRISKEGQVLTDARYFVKNRGQPHFRLILPAGTELWSATVNGVAAVPVKDGATNLITLPQRADPNALLTVDLKLAARSKNPKRVAVAAPIVAAPVMLAEWKLEPDTGQRLVYRQGTLAPAGGVPDVSGFAGLARMFTGPDRGWAVTWLVVTVVLTGAALVLARWAGGPGVHRFSARHVCGTLLVLVALGLAATGFLSLSSLAQQTAQAQPRTVTLLAPVQQSHSALTVEVNNLEEKLTGWAGIERGWPALLALAIWAYSLGTSRRWFRPVGWVLGWVLLAWTTLRWPNGAVAFWVVLGVYWLAHVLGAVLRPLTRLPRAPKPRPSPPASGTAAAATAALMLLAGWGVPLGQTAHAIGVVGNRQEGCAGRVSPLTPALSPLRGEGGAVGTAGVAGVRGERQQTLSAGRLLAQASPVTQVPSGGVEPRSREKRTLPKEPPLPQAVVQEMRVEDQFALATARIRWQAQQGQLLPVLFEPGVLTRASYPTNALKLVRAAADSRAAQHLLALASGTFEVELHYQVQVSRKDGQSGFTLPTPFGVVNHLTLTLTGLDVEVTSPQAVSVQRQTVDQTNTVARLVLAPANEVWIGWKPRTRDVKREKAVFHAELLQLYVPAAGVIEGLHQVRLRPAQGELSELVFDVPAGATITDVSADLPAEPATAAAKNESRVPGWTVSLWRFDPDTRKLRVTVTPAQSRPFTLLIRSQVATGPLPFEQAVGLLAVQQAATQLGLLGVATGTEVQLDNVNAEPLAPINLEDFPADLVQRLSAQFAGLTLRRAFRYADPAGRAVVRASAVEPDVRVSSQETLSLGEDRTVLAANWTVEITRAGVFRLSFLLPTGLEVESISGPALSHWTELRTEAGRLITLHLKGKTLGQQQFALSLAGPGVKPAKGWPVPRLTVREATKQQGQLLIVPEQGLRLQVAAREGVTQLDPQKAGVRQKGVLAFRLLQSPWSLTLDLEQVDAWVQVTSLQHVNVTEAQAKVAANLQYQIENTGLKALRVLLPTNAESVRFQGDQVADFLPVPGAVTNGLQAWEVKLHRRVMGRYLLQVTWQTRLPEQATQMILRGVQAEGVNLQRGFLTVQAGGRLQVRAEAAPAALAPAEWQSIPRPLRQSLDAPAASYTWRLVEPGFELPLKLERHEAAQLLPARVQRVTLTSVISDEGVMLTQARLELWPGDKRLLHLTLTNAQFWFAFVNHKAVWPWREADRILIPLEPQSRLDQPATVELFYSSHIGPAGSRALDLRLLGPKFDLPLENITWQVYLSEKWKLTDWTGSLQLQEETVAGPAAAVDLQTYLQKEASLQQEKTRQAEELLALGNTALERGDPAQARRAFQAAYGLSTHDDAFNEDARVQLHNLKLQQALVGLNVRQAAVAGEEGTLAAKLRDLRARKAAAYTQAEAKQILDAKTADETAALMRLAEKLVQQQDAALASPAAIRASVPQVGRVLTFRRAVLVDPWAELVLNLKARAVRAAPLGLRLATLLAVAVGLGLLAAARAMVVRSLDRAGGAS
jgi:hypothetical protein